MFVDSQGPVIIDLPQAVDAAANNNASRMLERDIENLVASSVSLPPSTTQYGRKYGRFISAANCFPARP
jgi:RIO kinase 1